MHYPLEDRANVRQTYRMLDDMALRARQAAERGETLPVEAVEAIRSITQTEDRDAQIRALGAIAEQVRSEHLGKLKALAPNEFNAFCEFINPEEPPESPWHVFLTGQLQESAETTEYRNLVLNCPPGHAKPVAETAWVTMANAGRRRLHDIQPGDRVLTHAGRTARVEEVHEQGELDTVKITTASGRTLQCAPDHPVFADGAFVPALDLRPGMVARDLLDFPRVQPDLPVAEYALAGLVCARGAHTTYRNRYGEYDNYKIITAEESVAAFTAEAFKAAGYGYSYRQCNSTALFHIRLNKDHEDLAPLFGWHIRHDDKTVPDWVFEGGRDGVLAFIEAFLFAGGEAPKRFDIPRIKLSLRTRAMALDLQQLLARLGVESRIERVNPKKRVILWIDVEGIGALNGLGLRWGGKLAGYVDRLDRIGAPAARRDFLDDEIVSIERAGYARCRCLTLEAGDHSFIADGLAVHNSTYASRLFVAWELGRDPDQRVIGGGHSQNFVENEFSKKIRTIVASPDYREVFPNTIIDHASRAANQWGLQGRRGQYVARGVGQGVHGFRADRIVVDDPYSKVDDAESPAVRQKVKTWFITDIGSRILPFGKIFLIMTRFHEDDLTGTILELNPKLPERDRYKHIDAPAICYDPENDILSRPLGKVLWDYYSLEYFRAKKVTEKYHRFSLIYQQLATAASDDSIASKINFYEYPPHADPKVLKAARDAGQLDSRGYPKIEIRDHYRRIIASVDTAAKKTERSDFSVVQVWGETYDGRHFLLDQRRDKVMFTQLVEMVESTARKWRVDSILVEDKGQGTAYIQARGGVDGTRRLAPAPVEEIKISANEGKMFRFDEVTPLIEEGIVYAPADRPWTDIFTREVGQFPDGAHDDQVDAMTQYLRYAKKHRRRGGARKVGSMG